MSHVSLSVCSSALVSLMDMSPYLLIKLLQYWGNWWPYVTTLCPKAHIVITTSLFQSVHVATLSSCHYSFLSLCFRITHFPKSATINGDFCLNFWVRGDPKCHTSACNKYSNGFAPMNITCVDTYVASQYIQIENQTLMQQTYLICTLSVCFKPSLCTERVEEIRKAIISTQCKGCGE